MPTCDTCPPVKLSSSHIFSQEIEITLKLYGITTSGSYFINGVKDCCRRNHMDSEAGAIFICAMFCIFQIISPTSTFTEAEHLARMANILNKNGLKVLLRANLFGLGAACLLGFSTIVCVCVHVCVCVCVCVCTCVCTCVFTCVCVCVMR